MRPGSLASRLRPSWQQGGVLGVFGAVLLFLAWPTLNGRSMSVVPTFQTATYPWAAQPRGLAYTWPQSDAAESAYPWAVLARRTWRSGDLPLWDPHSFGGGVPWGSDGVAATLYPVRALLDAALVPWLAHDLFVLVHLAIAGAGAYWLARRWGAGYAGATVAGVGWMTNAYVWVWAPLEMVTPFFAALPVVLAATDRALRSTSRRSVAIAAVALGLGLVSGNIAYSVILAAACGLFITGVLISRLVVSLRARRLRERDLAVTFAAGAGVVALGLALAAVALVPTLVNLLRVSRQPFTFEVLTTSLMIPWDTYRTVLERPASPPSAEQMAIQFYLTPAVVVLALAGFLLARGAGGWSARLVVVVPVLIASTVPGAWVAYHFFPGFDAVRPYGRLVPLALLGACVLAGLGADRLWSLAIARWHRPVPAWAGGLAAGLLVAGVFVPSYAVVRTQVPPPIDAGDYPQYPRTPLIRAIKQAGSATGWPARVLPVVSAYDTDPPSSGSPILIGATALVPGLDTWGGYASAVPEHTSDLLRLVGGELEPAVLGDAPAPEITHPVFFTVAVDWALACRLGTDLLALPPGPPEGVAMNWGTLPRRKVLDQIYGGPDGRLFQMPDGCSAGPHLTSEAVVADSEEDAVMLLRAQGAETLDDPDHLVETPAVLATGSEAGVTGGASGRIRSAGRDGSTGTVEATTDGPMWLVLPVAYDEGWSVSVDGEETEVEQVDFNRVGVLLGEGEHRVQFSYTPPGWTAGWLLSLSALLAVAVLFLPQRGRRSRRSDALSVGRKSEELPPGAGAPGA